MSGEGRQPVITEREREIIDGIATIIEMALPDEIEVFRLIKRSPDKTHAGLARYIAHAIRNRPIAIVDQPNPTGATHDR